MQRTLLVFGIIFVAGTIIVSSENAEKKSTKKDQFYNRHGQYNDETGYQQELWDAYYEAYPGSIRY